MYPDTKVLTACIIDDDPIYVFGFKKLLTVKNICTQLVNFENGMDALDFLSDPTNAPQLPDVIFLDVNMPVMDGWDFIEAFGEIKSQLGKDISIYMISSSINPADSNRAKNLIHISDYITKPISESTLSNLLQVVAA